MSVRTYVAFLRAINVGGRAVISMADLCAAFEAAGAQHVRSLIQSGNVLFDAGPRAATSIGRQLGTRLEAIVGTRPEIIIRTLDDIRMIAERAPFGAVKAGPKAKLYVTFLARQPARMPQLPLVSRTEGLEVVSVDGREAYVVSRPKPRGMFGFPNNFVEGQLGVAATTRNWNTVMKIAAMASR